MKWRRDVVVGGLRRRLWWLLPLSGHKIGYSFLSNLKRNRIGGWLKSRSLHTKYREKGRLGVLSVVKYAY